MSGNEGMIVWGLLHKKNTFSWYTVHLKRLLNQQVTSENHKCHILLEVCYVCKVISICLPFLPSWWCSTIISTEMCRNGTRYLSSAWQWVFPWPPNWALCHVTPQLIPQQIKPKHPWRCYWLDYNDTVRQISVHMCSIGGRYYNTFCIHVKYEAQQTSTILLPESEVVTTTSLICRCTLHCNAK